VEKRVTLRDRFYNIILSVLKYIRIEKCIKLEKCVICTIGFFFLAFLLSSLCSSVLCFSMGITYLYVLYQCYFLTLHYIRFDYEMIPNC